MRLGLGFVVMVLLLILRVGLGNKKDNDYKYGIVYNCSCGLICGFKL